jgi:hypothetical protein
MAPRPASRGTRGRGTSPRGDQSRARATPNRGTSAQRSPDTGLPTPKHPSTPSVHNTEEHVSALGVKRQHYGQWGSPVKVKANYLAINVGGASVVHYSGEQACAFV